MGITVLGAGGHARVVIAAAKAAGMTVDRVLDDSPSSVGTEILGVPVEGAILSYKGGPVFAAIGSNMVRHKLDLAFPNAEWVTIIHPWSFIDPSSSIGPGSLVCMGAVIQPQVRVGRHVIINTSSSVDHECVLEDYAQVAPGSHLGGRITMGTGSMAGIGCSIHQDSSLGPWSVLGGGAFLKGHLPEGVTAVGVPAKPLLRP